ncbi:MAG: precorrin-6y C5,15-methyltransferase (decarboxylating) subunit CbiE [Thermosynechococcaceae cyanobacterium]
MIYVVGIGLSGATGLSAQAQSIVAEADLLVGGQRHLQYFPEHPAPQWPLLDLNQTLDRLQGWRKDHPTGQVVVLASGDPLFYGIGRLLLTRFAPDELTFIPHFSSIQLAFNRIKLPWQDAQMVSVHGRDMDPLIKVFQQGPSTLAILTDATHTPAAIARLYLSLNCPTQYRWWVCENLEGPDERIQCLTPEQMAQQSFAPLNVVIAQREASPSPGSPDVPHLGIPDDGFLSFPDRPGLMTKREVRVLAIAELAISSHQVIWDIGAGTGSVSVELARLAPDSTIYAIEKDAAGIHLIGQNCARFQVANVHAISGEAPAALADLPDPDRIFIGGSGGHLDPLLEVCCQRLKTSGAMVLAIATLEHQHQAITALQTRHWNIRLLQVQLARSVAIAQLTRLHPLNPVVLIQAIPPIL